MDDEELLHCFDGKQEDELDELVDRLDWDDMNDDVLDESDDSDEIKKLDELLQWLDVEEILSRNPLQRQIQTLSEEYQAQRWWQEQWGW